MCSQAEPLPVKEMKRWNSFDHVEVGQTEGNFSRGTSVWCGPPSKHNVRHSGFLNAISGSSSFQHASRSQQ